MLNFTENYSEIHYKISQDVGFPNFSPSEIIVHLIPYTKDKIRTVRNKSGQMVTLNFAECGNE